LLVIIEDVTNRRELRVGIRRLLNHQAFAKDIVVASRQDLTAPPIGSALASAVQEGVVVYERPGDAD
jgi:hypothetical protein